MSKFIYCIFIAVLGIGSISCQNISSTENDLKVLNYALTLEHLEATFYNTFQNKYSSDDFNSAGLDPHLYDYLSVIQSHENAHVQALTQTIQQLGGTPVEQCNYNFDMVNDPASYLATAKLLENTGQGAYDGALNHLSNVQLQAVAASIATVEARHAAFLNKVLGDVPFPNATDPAYTPEEVVNAVKPFFRDCAGSTDFTPLVSTIRPNGVTGAPAAAIPENIKIPQNNAQYTTEQKQNDLKVLNYALTLEHLEANFYNQFQARYDVNAFRAAGFSDTDYSYVTLISAHENAHVQALQGTISAYGGSPVPECKYNFSGVTDVQSYIATAKVLENVGVSAYNGAANLITDVILQQVAATIDTVEGRHAAFLNLLVNGTEADAPFPSATDEGVAPANILKAAAGFISSCPYDINDANSLPGPAPAGSSQPTPNNPTPTNNNSAVSFYPSSFSMLSIFFLLASLLI